MYRYPKEINSKHVSLLLTACETSKKKLESIQHLQPPESKHYHSESTSLKYLTKKVPTVLRVKRSQEKQIENQAFEQYKRQVSTITPNQSYSPKKSHSLSTLNIRLSRVKSFQIAKEELETTHLKDQLEKINKKLENSVIKYQEHLKSRKNSALRTRKISQNLGFAKEDSQISLLEKVIKKRTASQSRKNVIIQELRNKVMKKQEKQKILNGKITEKIKGFKVNAKEKYLEIEKNLEKIDEIRSSRISLLQSYSKRLNSKNKLKTLSVLKNNQELKQQQ